MHGDRAAPGGTRRDLLMLIMAELQSYKGRFGLGIERDLYIQEKKASEAIKK